MARKEGERWTSTRALYLPPPLPSFPPLSCHAHIYVSFGCVCTAAPMCGGLRRCGEPSPTEKHPHARIARAHFAGALLRIPLSTVRSSPSLSLPPLCSAARRRGPAGLGYHVNVPPAAVVADGADGTHQLVVHVCGGRSSGGGGGGGGSGLPSTSLGVERRASCHTHT